MKEIFASRPIMWSAIALIGLISAIASSRYRYIKGVTLEDTGEVTVTGKVSDVSVRYGKTQIILNQSSFSGSSAEEIIHVTKEYSKPFAAGNKVTVVAKEDTKVKVGQQITVRGDAYLYAPSSNPGEFDTRKYNLGRGKVLQINANSFEITDDQYSQFAEKLRKYKANVKECFLHNLSEEDAGVMIAMLLGERDFLDEKDKELFREGGIMHIISISGMHISFLGGLIESLIKMLPLQKLYKGYKTQQGRIVYDPRSKKILKIVMAVTYIIPTILICVYVYMIPYSPSAIRAAVMFGLNQLGKLLGKTPDVGTNMSLAALFTLIFNPYACLDSGFLLSYVAVLGIATVCPVFHRFRKGHTSLFEKAFGSVPISASTLPIIMNSYYEVPIYAPVISPLMLPISSVILGLGIALAMLGRLSIPAKITAWIATAVLYTTRLLCALVSRIPGNMVLTGHRSALRVIIYLTVLGGGSLIMQSYKRKFWQRRKKLSNYARRHESADVDSIRQRERTKEKYAYIIYGAVMILNIALLFVMPERENKVTFLDVGQGDCCVVECKNKIWIIDGGSSSKKNVGSKIIKQYLWYEGRKNADVWVLTHPDNDHINGFTELASASDFASTVMIPRVLAEAFEDKCGESLAHCNVILLDRGDEFGCEEFVFKVISPSGKTQYEDDNEASLCLVAGCGNDCNLVFMADAGIKAEEAVTEYLSSCRTSQTVLKVAHHGSAIGTNTEDFIQKLNPDAAIISCGVNNVYGHPHRETIQRLKSVDAQILRTDLNGAVTIKFDAK